MRNHQISENKLDLPFVNDEKSWEKKMRNLPDKPVLPVKSKTNAPVRYQTFKKQILKEDGDKLKTIAKSFSIPLSQVFFAVFAETIANWSKSQNFCLKTNLHFSKGEENGDHNKELYLASDFVPFEINLSYGQSFTEFAKNIQKDFAIISNKLEPGNFDLIKLFAKVKYDSVTKALPIVFTNLMRQDLYKQQSNPESLKRTGSRKDNNKYWLNHTILEEDGIITINWSYRTDIFDRTLMDTMFKAYSSLIDKMATNKNAWDHYYYELTPKTQLDKRAGINKTNKEYPTELLHEAFHRTAAKFPNNIAVIDCEKQLTYKELDKLVYKVSQRILSYDKNKLENVVAIILEKGREQIIAALGILNAGYAYLPILPEMPVERQKYILNNAKVNLVLSQQHLLDKLQLPNTIKTICTDEEDLNSTDNEPVFEVKKNKIDDLAYIIYTSGSTGNPKGAMISHKGAYNTIYDINQRFSVNENDRLLALSDLSFDLSVYDIFGPLFAGAAVVIPRNSSKMFPMHWCNLIDEHKITIWNSVPAFMTLLNEFYNQCKADLHLRLILLSGDWIPLKLVSELKSNFPNAQLISLGGATEASIWSIIYPIDEIDSEWRSIPYGKPLNNQRFYVLNDQLEPCPDMVTGNLYIGGTGVALGYMNNEELSKSAFIIHPKTGEYIYKTGDLGRYMYDGNIEFLGREDFQVKISGYRIELEEIELALIKHASIKEAIVNACGSNMETKRLVAFIVKEKNSEKLTPFELKNYLKKKLPGYMIPNQIRFFDEFPLTSNGKVDRKKLLECECQDNI